MTNFKVSILIEDYIVSSKNINLYDIEYEKLKKVNKLSSISADVTPLTKTNTSMQTLCVN